MNSSFMTVCVGRFLIEIPHATKVIDEKYEIMGARLEFARMGLERHKEFLVEREKTLRADKRDPLKKMAHVPTAQGAIFVYGDDGAPVIYDVEGYAWSKDLLGGVQLKINGLTNLINMDQRIQTMSTELARFRNRRNNDIPAEDGFCVNGGFFAGQPSMESEFALIYYRLTHQPDVKIRITISVNGTNLTPPLLERLEKRTIPEAMKQHLHKITRLRLGNRPVGPLAGEESASTYNENGLILQKFRWEMQGKSASLYEPNITLELTTGIDPNGQSVQSSLTNQQAIELFDRIVNSIRLRPATPGKTSDASDPNSPSPAAPKRLPLKSKVTSSSNCPQTGIWECAADAPGITEHRRLITAGQGMPYGVVQRPAKGVSGFLGEMDDDAVEISWTLAAYDMVAS